MNCTPDNTPIVVPCFERPEFLQENLDALAQCEGIENFTVHFPIDMKKKNSSSTKEVFDICRQWDKSEKKIYERYGLWHGSQNSTGAPSFVMRQCGYNGGFIYIEEDVVVSKCFLQYCLDALNFYRNNPYVNVISGYNYHYSSSGEPEETKIDRVSIHPTLLGVCSWMNRWAWIDKYLQGFLQTPSSIGSVIKETLHIPSDYKPLMDHEINEDWYPHNVHGMGLVSAYGLIHGRYYLYPNISLTTHVGWYGWHIHKDNPNYSKENCHSHAKSFHPDNTYSKDFLIVNKGVVSNHLGIDENKIKDADSL